jgi:hypothetical protein
MALYSLAPPPFPIFTTKKNRQQMKAKFCLFEHFHFIPSHSAFQSNGEAALGAFAFETLGKRPLASPCLSVRTKQLGSH